MGALTGAISGAMFYGAGNIIGGLGLGAGPTVTLGERAAMAGIHTAAGMISGGINSAITGSNIGLGVVAGGISAGTSEFLGGDIPGVGNKYADFAIELAGRSLSGGVTCGIAAEIYGGDFGHGFAVGAATGAAGFLFNKVFHYGTTLYRVGPNGQLTPIVENIPEGTDVTEPSDPLLNAYKQLMVTGAKFGVNQGLQRVGTQVLGMGLISSKIFFGASVGILFDLALPREAE